MTIKTNLIKAGALGAAVTILTAGAAFAAVATTSVNVRSGPSTSYRVVDTLAPGEYVNITGRSNGWCAVTKPGPNGWVNCAYLSEGRYRPRPVPVPDVTFHFGFGYPPPMHHHRPPPPRPWPPMPGPHHWWW
ncbi:MAG: hypothetical protein BGO82_05895 [Devosia sp. 67-54]|uniref:SH3 domain-containing protein n=1 Tax=unclassified Devosia TaxID=196773 RepID=UPI00086A1F38|nr:MULTISPECIES: SH3 domain-containing protein [unclassified Devosia]MBN9306850.1 SH3 domain-containing protein [Devosia sp.]ODU62549.1 MAG: hypothetical protein ABT13_00815 [Pelagibacterium sp. SCN 68-10]OJX17044.1 MAG: hypothetical protein BGO82_05895 [Devosia sp. 67-54]